MQQNRHKQRKRQQQKQTVTTSAIIGVLLFSAIILHFFAFIHIYISIYIYVVFFLSFCECQFQLHSQSLCILSPHFVLRCVFFWGWSNLSPKHRQKQGSPVVGGGTISPYPPYPMMIHDGYGSTEGQRRQRVASKNGSSNGWADGRL